MKELFPVEIQENTVQKHWVKRQIKSKGIYLIIIISLLAFFVCLPFINIDVTSQSRGTIRSPNENNSLQSAIYAEVAEIYLCENKTVNSGDTLIKLKTDEIDEQIYRLEQKQFENNQFITDIDKLLAGSSLIETPKYRTEKAHYEAKLSEQIISFRQADNEYKVSKKLYDKGVETKFEFQQAESRYKTAESQVSLIKQQQANLWQAEKTRLEYENRDLLSQLLQLEKRKSQYVITAPVSGTIVQYIGMQVGNFITPGQSIAQITSSDSLLVECYVNPADIGYMRILQDVNFQIDAFNYQQWGLLHGKVTEIIPDIVQINEQPFFRVRCLLDKHYLELPNGYRGNIKKGMTTTARFYLSRRSLWQLLFDKIDNWINPKIITDGNKD